ncbi:isochorismatase family protein [Staphylococcus canis]|uniref:Isochorismatase family protein n=1 Tax=Staphylococcus canis TaxID=2724942 RepID=A0ABS0TCM3_9STAP|nr:isochorismatase family protein [Staphylococcus canis]MBI5975726.1 isochorismatase family protein [Staphylococcus canis]
MIDFKRTALILVDLQQGIVGLEGAPHETSEVIRHANQLIQTFRDHDAFIAFVHVKFHDGKDKLNPNAMVQLPDNDDAAFSEFATDLDYRDSDYVVAKRHFSAFFGTDLDLQLRRRGIDTVVIGGISTHIGVDTTARDAYQYGYHQFFITDMMTAPAAHLHQFSVDNVFPLMGQTMTTADFINTMI